MIPRNLRTANALLVDALSNLIRKIERDNLNTTHGISTANARAALSKNKALTKRGGAYIGGAS